MKILINKIQLLVCLSVIIGFSSCEDFYSVDCSECYQEKPEWGPLIIDVTINDENPYVPIIIFNNKIEDQDTDWVDTIRELHDTIDVRVNKDYSVVARYIVDNDTILAVDGDKLKIKKITEACDETCWIYSGGHVNLELKYD